MCDSVCFTLMKTYIFKFAVVFGRYLLQGSFKNSELALSPCLEVVERAIS